LPIPSSRRRAALVLTGGLAILSLVLYLGLRAERPTVRDVPFSDLLRMAAADDVRGLDVDGESLTATLKSGERIESTAPAGYVAMNPTLIPDLVKHGVKVTVHSSSASVVNVGTVILSIGFLVLIAFALFRLGGGRLPSMEGESRLADRTRNVVTFSDVAGVDEAKAEVREIVDFLREPARYGAIGGRIPKGVLLVGPPGTGKTLLARSIAGEAGVPFIYASGSDFVEMYAGVGAARIRRMFRDARKHGACIVFIDELDAVGRSRGGQSLSHEEREQTLNQLLVEMDGFAANQGIVVVAATNRADILDKALLRPGRFDRQVMVTNPDLRGREAILKIHVAKVAMEPGVDLASVARGTPGFSGADLANLVNEAALLAARAGRAAIALTDLDLARDKVLMGAERRSLVMSEDERRTTAYHEAGHALVAALLPGTDPVHKVTIIPRGRALGVTMQLPEADRHTYSKDYLDAQLAILMGGRVAEEIFTARITSGAGNDIERVTDIARRMVCEFGMSPLGPIAYRTAGAPWQEDRAAGMSEATARRVDEEIQHLVMTGYQTAHRLISENQEALIRLAEELLEVESLDADAVRALLKGDTDGDLPIAACSTV
jgi:cell division protease FtsH